jgi:hypothetical protein
VKAIVFIFGMHGSLEHNRVVNITRPWFISNAGIKSNIAMQISKVHGWEKRAKIKFCR